MANEMALGTAPQDRPFTPGGCLDIFIIEVSVGTQTTTPSVVKKPQQNQHICIQGPHVLIAPGCITVKPNLFYKQHRLAIGATE